MKKLVTFCAIMLAAACGGVADDGEGMSPDAGADDQPDSGDAVDTTAPTIMSITPADGATGVRADAAVTIVFSEDMDQLSVQNSLDTSDLGGVTFSWSNGYTLVITPDNPLVYADGNGNDPSAVTANRYTVVLGTGATDEAGNNVDIGVSSTFTTLKSMKTSFGRDNALTGAGDHVAVTTDADDFLYVGDDDAAGLASGYRGYITIDLADLPESTVEIVAANLGGYQLAEVNNPYAVLGAGTGLIIEHGSFTLGSSNEDNAAFNMTPLSQVGVFANVGDTALDINVTDQVADDVANRAARSDRSQYRLRLTTITNLDAVANYVLIGRDELALNVHYLAP